MDKEVSRWGLALLVLVTLAVRIGVIALEWKSFGKDTDDYGRLAQGLVATGTYGYPVENTADAKVNDAAEGSPVKKNAPSGAVKMRPTAYRPPLYPGLLCAAFIKGKFNSYVAAGLHVIIGLLTVMTVFYLAWRMEFKAPWIPALAVACDPILLKQSLELMTEGLVTFLAVWAWALHLTLLRPTLAELGQTIWGMRFWLRTSLFLGLALGLACLTRPTMLPWACIAIGSLALRTTTAGNRVSIISAALLVLLAINVGWMVRNKRELGRPIFTTTHGGYTLLLANNETLYRHFRNEGPSRNWDEGEFHDLWSRRDEGDPTQPEFWKGKTKEQSTSPSKMPGKPSASAIEEIEDDQLASQAAIATIKRDPATFALSCLYRAGWFWSPYPNLKDQPYQQWVIGAWYSSWFLFALGGLVRLSDVISSRQWMIPVLLVLSLTAIHCIYWSNMRMRAPAMPVIYILACWPLMRIRTLPRFAG